MPPTQEIPTTSPIGRRTPRVDGPQKVSGRAQYASDFHFPGILYAVPAEATTARGRVLRVKPPGAKKRPGGRAFFNQKNTGKFFPSVRKRGLGGFGGGRPPPMED